jgi:transcriptional regulator with XRE-family HTH domain
METFGERLRRMRDGQGLRQRELAQRAEMDSAQVSRYERGVIREPSADVLARLARALNVSVQELRGETELDSDRARLTQVWGRATPEQKRSIMAAIRRVERGLSPDPSTS